MSAIDRTRRRAVKYDDEMAHNNRGPSHACGDDGNHSGVYGGSNRRTSWWRWKSARRSVPAARGTDTVSVRRSYTVVLMTAILVLALVLKGNHRRRILGVEWKWDLNNYDVRKRGVPQSQMELGDNETMRGRNLLIVQEAGSRPLANIKDVTARVNRAYAKQWGHDYVGFTGSPFGGELWHATFTKAFILQTLLEEKDEASRQPRSIAPDYDVVLMLDVDAIITDLDYDVLDMFPKDRLLGITDSSSNGSWKLNGGLIFWNLNHPEIRTMSKLWMDMVEASLKDPMADGLVLMSNVLSNAYTDDSERLVHTVRKPLADYFAGIVVKYFRKPSEARSKIDWLENDSELIASALQQIADAVCIRYYPKCEVV